MRLLSLAVLLATLGCLAAETGSVCLRRAVWEYPKGTQKTEHDDVTAVKRFSVRIDDQPAIDVSERSGRVDGLALEVPHTIRVLADGKVTESFKFTFKNRGARFSLNFKPFYGAWSLDEAKRECTTQ